MPHPKIYYDSDADISVLDDKRIVFLGYGNQGSAQAQNVRDTGLSNILIANRGDRYAEQAREDGFEVTQDYADAAKEADVLFLLVPDQVQPHIFNSELVQHLKPNVTVVVASGYNVFYKSLNFGEGMDVVMVAPRMIGVSVRSRYVSGQGFPCFISVEQDGTGSAHQICLALARAIGATKAGAITSSAREETAMDLFAEQGLWPKIIACFREAFSVLKEAGCSDEALCYEMWMSKEPAEIFEKAADEGFFKQLKHHSTVSQYGQLKGGLEQPSEPLRSEFKEVLYNRVLNGAFFKEFTAIEKRFELEGNENPLNALYAEYEKSELGVAETGVRERLSELL
ncbi:hypothetical protein YB2330_001957 [Saitoella coloradoensis]